MYKLILKYIFLISIYLNFYTYILVENNDQNYILNTVFMSEGLDSLANFRWNFHSGPEQMFKSTPLKPPAIFNPPGIKSPFQKVCSVITAHVHAAAVHAMYMRKSKKK
jgi:hypothetical protein